MKRHRNHQIDELAQQVLRDAIPPTWVPNEQHKDYGKDYLVEIGEDNGELTGSSFYLQLKGQEQVAFTADSKWAKFSVESKHARYYFDKIKDLPVFLVVVDVNRKRGWWLFLQPVLGADKSWKRKRSITVSLPVGNDVTDTLGLRNAVEEAKKWMRLHHPVSIHESVVAHKRRITDTDPRFDVKVSLVDDQPKYTLLAKEEVPLKFTFSGKREDIRKKVSDLIDKGAAVAFQPGELKVTGSKLFESLDQGSCEIQATVTFAGTLSLICRDGEGKELERLSDIPGHFTGGQRELWFNGGLVNTPLTIKLGPIAPDTGGSLQMNLDLHRWDRQLLTKLAYFDRLSEFFQAVPQSASTTVECRKDGNVVFTINSPFQNQPFAIPLAGYLKTLSKARKVAHRFNANPTWAVEACDDVALETAEQLYAIFFENGWCEPTPNVRVKARCIRKTFNFDVARNANKPGSVRLASDCSSRFFGETIELGRLVHDYNDMKIEIQNDRSLAKSKNAKSNTQKKRRVRSPSRKDTVQIALIGSQTTVMKVRVEEQSVTGHGLSPPLFSSQCKIISSSKEQGG